MTIDELRAKFEAWYPNAIGDVQPFECYMKGYASRDAEVEVLKDALFQISVRLNETREPDMDDMSWHTQLIARAQWMADQCQRIESAPVVTAIRNSSVESAIFARDLPIEWEGKRVRLVVEVEE